jgi:hypothetical protein
MIDGTREKPIDKKSISGSEASSEDATPASNAANPKHRVDFNSLVNAAARKQKQDE